jgi:hypothetical protein
MAITSLSEVQNDYGSYRGNSLVGKLGAVTSVPNDGLSGIIGKPYPFLNGILVKIGGNIYTDSGYLNALKSTGNPYLSKRSLPTVSLSLSDLTQLVPDIIVHGSVTRTKYAEVSITKRMSTIEDILRYLNDFFNPNTTDTVLTPQTLGSFNLITTDYFPDLDVSGQYPGLEFETFEDIATATSATISTPPTVTEPKTAEVRPVVEVAEEKPLVTSKPKTKPKVFGIPTPSPNFLLNDSVDFTREILETPIGLRDTGLRDAYDTGNYGPMAAILDSFEEREQRLRGGSVGLYSGNNFGRFTI